MKAAILCQSLQVTEDTATASVLMKLRISTDTPVYIVIHYEKDPKFRRQISKREEGIKIFL